MMIMMVVHSDIVEFYDKLLDELEFWFQLLDMVSGT
jgi:hypothetical protein